MTENDGWTCRGPKSDGKPCSNSVSDPLDTCHLHDDPTHDYIDYLAASVEAQIAHGERFLEELDDFEPRSNRARKFQQSAL